jgi:Eco47II restriction endonuclease
MQTSEEVQNCSYLFKKGALKGERCKNPVNDGTSLCAKHTKKLVTVPSSVPSSVDMSWYKIGDKIQFEIFHFLLQPIYETLEKSRKSRSSDDPFLKTVLISHKRWNQSQWEEHEIDRLHYKLLEMLIGKFHESLIGKFDGYENLQQGDESGCDVRKKDCSEYFEIKNRNNTMNSDSGKSVIVKLTKLSNQGKLAVLVEINCPNDRVTRFGTHQQVQVWNGAKMYAYISGRPTFFSDLIDTLGEAFRRFTTYNELLYN